MTKEQIEKLAKMTRQERLADLADSMGSSVSEVHAMAQPFYKEVEEFEEMVMAVIKRTLLDAREAPNGDVGTQIVMAGMSHKLCNLAYTLLGVSVKNLDTYQAIGELLAKRCMETVKKHMVQEAYGNNNEQSN